MTRHDAERKRKILDYIAAMIRAQRGSAVRARDREGSRPRLHVRRPPPPAGSRGGGLPRARRGPVADDPPDPEGRPPAGPVGRAHAAVACAVEAHVLPVIGEIAAGGPIEAYASADEYRAIPDLLAASGDAYLLRVRGDSMIDALIADGDYVVIRPQQTARNGDIVVAQVEENAVTLKRFFKEEGRVRLQPANQQYPPHVLRRRPDPGQAHRGHPPPRLTGRSVAVHSPSTGSADDPRPIVDAAHTTRGQPPRARRRRGAPCPRSANPQPAGVAVSIDRLPPQSLEAEQSVLGALLIDRDAIIEVADVLRPGRLLPPGQRHHLRRDDRPVGAPRADRHRHGRRGPGARGATWRRSAARPTCHRSPSRRRRPSSRPSTPASSSARRSCAT